MHDAHTSAGGSAQAQLWPELCVMSMTAGVWCVVWCCWTFGAELQRLQPQPPPTPPLFRSRRPGVCGWCTRGVWACAAAAARRVLTRNWPSVGLLGQQQGKGERIQGGAARASRVGGRGVTELAYASRCAVVGVVMLSTFVARWRVALR